MRVGLKGLIHRKWARSDVNLSGYKILTQQNIGNGCVSTCILKLGGKMAKLFDGLNRYISFIQALLVSVCFASPLLQLAEKPPQLLRRSSEGNTVGNTVHAWAKEG